MSSFKCYCDDISFGNELTTDASPVGFYAAVKKTDGDVWYEMYKHTDFQKVVKENYNGTYRRETLDMCDRWMPEITEMVEASVVMDIMRYHMCDEVPDKEKATIVFNEEVALLKGFIEERVAYLSSEWE